MAPENKGGPGKAFMAPAPAGPTTFSRGDAAFGKYLVIDVLPNVNSTIYKATETSSGRAVAIKEVALKQYGGKWKRGELTRREFFAGRKLGHPNLPHYYESYGDPNLGDFFHVREWVEGESLHDLLVRGVRLTEQQMRIIILGVLDAVEYLHGFPDPIIHRDVKPGNVVVDFPGQDIRGVKLIDLDAIAKPSAAPQREWTTHVGTPGFAPPEQLSKPCPQSDLFAAAATLLFMRTGKDADAVYAPSSGAYEVPREAGIFAPIISKGMKLRTSERFQTAKAMKKALMKLKIGGSEMVSVEEQRKKAWAIDSKYIPNAWFRENVADRFRACFGWSMLAGLVTASVIGDLVPGDIIKNETLLVASFAVVSLLFGMAENIACSTLLEIPHWFGVKFGNWRAVSSARRQLLSGSTTDPQAQEKLAALVSKGRRSYWQVRAARKLLSNPAPLSPKAEELLAGMITKPEHAEELLAARQVRSPEARAHLMQVAHATEADVKFALLPGAGEGEATRPGQPEPAEPAAGDAAEPASGEDDTYSFK